MQRRVGARMSVTEVKTKMVEMLEQLQRDGIWITEIDLRWATNVEAKDVPKPASKTQVSITFKADL
jgi:hypothetical protein